MKEKILISIAVWLGAMIGCRLAAQTKVTPAQLNGTGAPTANCIVGQRYFRTDGTAGQNEYFCTATNTWTAQGAGTGGTIANPYLTIGSSNAYTPSVTLPSGTSGMAFGNQISATINTTNGQWSFYFPPVASSNVVRYVKTAGSSTYTVTAGLRVSMWAAAAQRCGLGFRESATNKMTFVSFYQANNYQVVNYSNNTTPTSTAFDRVNYSGSTGLMYFRIQKAASTLIYSISLDGVVFATLATVNYTTFFTTAPDEYGIFCDANNPNTDSPVLLQVVSFEVV